MRQLRLTILLILGILTAAFSGQRPRQLELMLAGTPGTSQTGNAIDEILIDGNRIWIGAGRGVAFTDDLGATWTQFRTTDGLSYGSITGMDYRHGELWIATGFDSTTSLGTHDTGGGLAYTLDDGDNWHRVPQPVDPPSDSVYAASTPINNVTYDVAVADGAVWIASFAGGLRRTRDRGESWDVITVDGNTFDAVNHLTHRLFSVCYDGEAVWAGSAGGIHKSTDSGETWTTFNHHNQAQGISGNFVVALESQDLGDREIVWAATIEAVDSTEVRAVSYTEDGGLTWHVTLAGEFAHNFGFDFFTGDVYACTDNGLFKSVDLGETWALYPTMVDAETGDRNYDQRMLSVGASPQTGLWAGSADGLGWTPDNGLTWTVFRAFQKPGRDDNPETYAFPNPFSPTQQSMRGGEAFVRLVYETTGAAQVTVRVYDYGMHLVRSVVENKARPMPGNFWEVWNGMNDVGDAVATGVYFYRIDIDNREPLWGKVMVVN